MMASNTLVRGAWMVIVRWIVIGPVRSGVDCGWFVWVWAVLSPLLSKEEIEEGHGKGRGLYAEYY